MKRLNLGCGKWPLAGWINLDVVRLPGVDVVADLERCAETPLPFESDSIDEFLLSHLIEHIRSPLSLMQELWRIARPGARLTVRCPYGHSDDAWEDPTHVRPYFIGSFGFFSQPYYWRADYGYRGDWRPDLITLIVPRGALEGVSYEAIYSRVMAERNIVNEMVAELTAVKPARPPDRGLIVPPRVDFRWVE